MGNNLTPYDDRKCPIYRKIIDGELCYETALCMKGQFKITSVPEAKEIKLDFNIAKNICINCQYADMQ